MLDDLIKESANRRDVFKKLGATALGAAALLGLGIALATDRRRRIGRTGR